MFRDVGGCGVIENIVSLGPLTLRASLRLFARLSPLLREERSKLLFVSKVLPSSKYDHVTVQSRDLTEETAKLLEVLAYGHPAKIVKLACEDSDGVILNKLGSSEFGENIYSSSPLST